VADLPEIAAGHHVTWALEGIGVSQEEPGGEQAAAGERLGHRHRVGLAHRQRLLDEHSQPPSASSRHQRPMARRLAVDERTTQRSGLQRRVHISARLRVENRRPTLRAARIVVPHGNDPNSGTDPHDPSEVPHVDMRGPEQDNVTGRHAVGAAHLPDTDPGEGTCTS
jgi:hypothetical protein